MDRTDNKKYLGIIGAWALSFGCSVGWGSFVMPGTTFLPIAGPVGTALGLALGGFVMLVLALNFHYLMNRYPVCGGIYTYTKKAFGYDHGFLSAWFLIITYIAIIWANATALPLIARTVMGDVFRFGYLYSIAGYEIYVGEILLSVFALIIATLVCFNRKLSASVQALMALILFIGVIICFTAAVSSDGCTGRCEPAFATDKSPESDVFTIFALAPWAFVGFESITHSAEESKFSLKKSFIILLISVITAAAAYVFLSLLAVMALPDGCSSWTEYIDKLDSYSGNASLPTFFAAHTALGNTGTSILGAAALGAIFTGLIGNYIALSRLLCSLSEDGLIPHWFGRKTSGHVPKNAIITIFAISIVLPFFGRTAISWIVDVTTVGATVAYALASAAAWKLAYKKREIKNAVIGIAGMVISILFALEFLIPNILSISTLSMESYFILTIWSILGFLYFRVFLRNDHERRMGHSILAWIVLLGLIIFTSSVWVRQTTDKALKRSEEHLSKYITVSDDPSENEEIIEDEMDSIGSSLTRASSIQIALICLSLITLLRIYSILQKRQKQIEIEKALAEESSRAKTSFLSNMSHEIRTPMNAIIGLDNIALRDPDLPPKTRDHLEKIGSSADHLLRLINDILDMSRIESGRMVLKNEEFSFREFLDQINIIISGQCQDKGLDYDCSIVGELNDYYIGDDLKLKQVIINILGNSVKFTDTRGRVTLTVEQISQADGICFLRFIMKDTGIGMDKEFIPKIFESFSQEDATTTNRYGGSGLGMAITKNFVEMMGGDIHVESEKGVGSVFTVTVKLTSSDRKSDRHGIRLPEGLRAFVVDADEVSSEHTKLVLKAIGIESDTCTDTAFAEKHLREESASNRAYDLLIIDHKMSDMNGIGLTRFANSSDSGDTAVILLTGYGCDIHRDADEYKEADSILAKPLFSDVLLREIHRILSQRDGISGQTDDTADIGHAEEILAGRRVLMAEDVEQNAEILADLLELEDIDSVHAINGKEAVRMFTESEPGYYDAILMDVRMPEMDGLTATRTIRELERPDAKTIPIIAMTANVFDEDIERSAEAGMNAHLFKPVEPEKLYETMARLMSSADKPHNAEKS
ncbi:amino acid permease [uncultured Ruminococcus sp.]|uniref:amino acid permease n=1 Tax=uncultured Ruminococcus sp. TaxID=165186 RepID=UPI0025D0CAFC|nr:amino acid permease [uncultured Ruminococcus sp.]